MQEPHPQSGLHIGQGVLPRGRLHALIVLCHKVALKSSKRPSDAAYGESMERCP